MKKIIVFIVFVLIPCFGLAESIVIFSTNTNNCLRFLPSRDPFPYISRVDAMIFSDITSQTESEIMVLISTTPIRYFKKVGNPQITEMNSTEKAAVDAAIALTKLLSERSAASNLYDNPVFTAKALRAIVLLLIDELNDLRRRDRERSADVAAASTLANLKTLWAARSALNDRTASQARTAILNKIDSGSAD